ncbi:sigma factor [Roseovarius lutimaris]|uniref:sigma factor n=1 Tax=Roseovarius lutimaris TaxID=1005928 RepID=UPI003CCBEADE
MRRSIMFATVSFKRRDHVVEPNSQGRPYPVSTRSEIEGLIARVGLGDRRAFSMLYDATSAKLFGVRLRILNNRAEAEDALQEVFVRIWQR